MLAGVRRLHALAGCHSRHASLAVVFVCQRRHRLVALDHSLSCRRRQAAACQQRRAAGRRRQQLPPCQLLRELLLIAGRAAGDAQPAGCVDSAAASGKSGDGVVSTPCLPARPSTRELIIRAQAPHLENARTAAGPATSVCAVAVDILLGCDQVGSSERMAIWETRTASVRAHMSAPAAAARCSVRCCASSSLRLSR